MMTVHDFLAAVLSAANNHKTLYVSGGIGYPLDGKGKQRALANAKNASRSAKIKAATADTFAFDCVCLIKSILWGWTGDPTKIYGGAVYASNGVPDISEDAMIAKCSGVSADFGKIVPGEVVWIPGHIGVYVGDGLAVECTPAWDCGVQITAVANIGSKSGYNSRKWQKHGKLPWVSYTSQAAAPAPGKTEAVSAYPVTRRGDKGAKVKALQAILSGYGYYLGVWGIDGDFGADTEKAVKSCQKYYGLSQTGIADETLWRNMLGVK